MWTYDMKKYIVFFIMLSPTLALAEDSASWTPVVNFHLESSNYTETLLWISGNSYAYSSVSKEMEREKVFCTKIVGSKVLLDILNSRYSGQKITSEQASDTFIQELPLRFPCE